MNERLTVLSFNDGGVSGNTLGANYRYTDLLADITIVGVVASANVDDTGLTIDINDDGTGVITGIAANDASAPGSWLSTHMGGTNTPVKVAGGSILSLDANSAAASTQVHVEIWALIGNLTGT